MGNKNMILAEKIAELKKEKIIDALEYYEINFQSATVESINGKNYNVLSSENGKYYFDIETGLLYQGSTKEGHFIVKKYITVEGIKFPEEIEAERNGQTITIRLTKVILNSGVSEEDFKE